MKIKLLVFLIFIFGFLTRIYGLNWDQGTHLHPDERFLTMVATDIKLPNGLPQYFDTSTSPLNPYNYKNYQFFVYGTFPIFLTKTASVLLNLDNYDRINLVGRVLSALVDSLCILLIYKILEFNKQKKIGLLASFLYATAVLPLQQSHFFAVDTYLNFFLLLTFFHLQKKKHFSAGSFFGLALACKISALYFSPVILIFIIKNKSNFFKSSFLFGLSTLVLFRVFQPYVFLGLFKINPLFIENLKTLRGFSSPEGWFPPSVQWISKTPILFPLQNIILWGAGLGLTLLIFTALKAKKDFLFFASSFWVILLIILQGKEFAHTLRYFLPIYPFLAILASVGFFTLKSRLKYLFVALHLLWGIFFLTIYSVPHSRVQASSWIYRNLPLTTMLSFEYWDDPLPLNIEGRLNTYQSAQLAPYDLPDKPNKLARANEADFIVMSSNRLWGSIPKVPQKYPYTTLWYQDLFSHPIYKKFVSYPGVRLPLGKCYYIGPTDYPANNTWFDIDASCNFPGIYLRDDLAEEAFTVYDHPQVILIKNSH